MRRRRTYLLVLSSMLVAWLLAELLARATIELLPASSALRRIAYPPRFRLNRFTKYVEDERVAVLVPGFQGVLRPNDPRRPEWRVRVDDAGFRGRLMNYETSPRVVAFIGDSVPFGWGLSERDTVPFRFQELLERQGASRVGVLNAAVPSYTLLQAQKQFDYALAGEYPIASVVLQVFDPITQFAMYGENWHSSISTASRERDAARPLLGLAEQYVEYSLAAKLVLRVIYNSRRNPIILSPSALTAGAWTRFDRENERVLSQLLDDARAAGFTVVLLPVNPAAPERHLSATERAVIAHFNEHLRDFAEGHPEVYYFDVNRWFDTKPVRRDLFIDSVHLSAEGARAQAEFLFDAVQKHGLIPPEEDPEHASEDSAEAGAAPALDGIARGREVTLTGEDVDKEI